MFATAVKSKLYVVLTSEIIYLRQIQSGARYVEAFKCLASEFYVVCFPRRDFLSPSVWYISKPRSGIMDYGTGRTWLRECRASHFIGDPGVKGMIILKVGITAAGCEVAERTELFYKVLRIVYCIISLTPWTFSFS